VHELSLAVAIVELAERHARGRPVSAVNVRVGALRQVVPRSLSFQFGFASRGSACEGATLVQEPVSARLCCGDCGREWDPAPASAATSEELVVSFRCPGCRSSRFSVTRGEELEVDSIEVVDDVSAGLEREGERCTGPR
jgi:hydrogenase nickel incorporation protein HypA/HybF